MISDALELKDHRVVSLIGSGGKTTLMRRLAQEAASQGLRVVKTTTTHIWPERDTASEPRAALSALRPGETITLGTRDDTTAKLTAPSAETLALAIASADRVFIEADGAKGHPLKRFAPHEPVIVAATDAVVYVVGLQALGHRLGACCFRLGAWPTASEDACVTPNIIMALLDEGLRHLGDWRQRCRVALIGVDRERERAASTILEALARRGVTAAVLPPLMR